MNSLYTALALALIPRAASRKERLQLRQAGGCLTSGHSPVPFQGYSLLWASRAWPRYCDIQWMKSFFPAFFAVALSLFSLPISASAFQGNLSFSEEEVQQHQEGLETILSVASKCLQQDLETHQQFMKKYGVSKFYGENASFAKVVELDAFGQEKLRDTTDEEKRQKLREKGFAESLVQALIPSQKCRKASDCPMKMEATSCVGLALKCLKRGFEAAGQNEIWARLRKFTRDNDVTGNSLQYGLQLLGWRVIYWNPDPRLNREWDESERRTYPTNPKYIWGRHSVTYKKVMEEGTYGGLHVDDVTSAVGFGKSTPQVFKRAPFFVGIGHQGYHVFPGMYGRVVEAHSMRDVTDPLEIQAELFSPLTPGEGPQGGPRSILPGGHKSDTYRSGIVAVPPGF